MRLGYSLEVLDDGIFVCLTLLCLALPKLPPYVPWLLFSQCGPPWPPRKEVRNPHAWVEYFLGFGVGRARYRKIDLCYYCLGGPSDESNLDSQFKKKT